MEKSARGRRIFWAEYFKKVSAKAELADYCRNMFSRAWGAVRHTIAAAFDKDSFDRNSNEKSKLEYQ